MLRGLLRCVLSGHRTGQASRACEAELVEVGSDVYGHLPIVKKPSFFFFLDQ